jgi:hypothetical protein
LVIELARGDFPLQPMLTIQHDGTRLGALRRASIIAHRCKEHGYIIVRCKIEKPLSLQGASDTTFDAKHQYFEWHGRVTVEDAHRDNLIALVLPYGGHLSRNALRGSDKRYITLREPHNIADLQTRVARLQEVLCANDWEIDKQQWEQVVHDIGQPLDSGWLEEIKQ